VHLDGLSSLLVEPQLFLIAELIALGRIRFTPQAIVEIAQNPSLTHWKLVRIICDGQNLPLGISLPSAEERRNGADCGPFNKGAWFLLGDGSDPTDNLHLQLCKLIPQNSKLADYFQYRFFGLEYMANFKVFFNDPRNFKAIASTILEASRDSAFRKTFTRRNPFKTSVAIAMIANCAGRSEMEAFKVLAHKGCFRSLWPYDASRFVRIANAEEKVLYLLDNDLIDIDHDLAISFLLFGLADSFKRIVPSLIKKISLSANDLFPWAPQGPYANYGQFGILAYAIHEGALDGFEALTDHEELFAKILPLEAFLLYKKGILKADLDTYRRFAQFPGIGSSGSNCLLFFLNELCVNEEKVKEFREIYDSLFINPGFEWTKEVTRHAAELKLWNAVKFGLRYQLLPPDKTLEDVIDILLKEGKIDLLKFMVEEVGMAAEVMKVVNGRGFVMRVEAGLRTANADCYFYLLNKGSLLL